MREERNNSPWGLVYRFACEKLTIQEAMSSINFGNESSDNYMDSLKLLVRGLLPLDNSEEYDDEKRELLLLNEQYRNEFRIGLFTEKELEIVMSQLKSNKAPGWEGVSNEIMREAVTLIPEQFLEVFNTCLKESVFPLIWKNGVLKFLLKSTEKDKRNVRSYRPICLLPVIRKLLERLIVVKLKKWVGNMGLYHPRQFGFTEGKCTSDAVNEVIKYVTNTEEKIVVAITVPEIEEKRMSS